MDYNSKNYKSKGDGLREIEPKHSRLFMLGAKHSSDEDLKEVFSKFGKVEYVSIKKDHSTNAPKGFSYIKFRKASEAAAAMEEMNGKTIGSDPRPIKIVIASARSDGQNKDEVKATRLFIKVPKTMDIPDIKAEFEAFGPVEHVSLVRDKATGNPRGCAFVNYHTFLHAAQAVENCSQNYQAVFAEPKGVNPHAKGMNNMMGDSYGSGGMGTMGGGYSDMGGGYQQQQQSPMMNMMQGFQQANSSSCRLKVLFNPSANRDMFWALFNIVPGLVSCDMINMTTEGAVACVVYSNPQSAAYAVEKINGFEIPTGSRLRIRIDESNANYSGSTSMNPAMNNGMGMTNGGMNGSMGMQQGDGNTVPANVETLINTIQQATAALQNAGFVSSNGGSGVDAQNVCSAQLPPKQPILPMNTKTEERLFFVLREAIDMPNPAIITDVFCRFGNLIEAQCIRGKKCGYARFGSKKSADAAIRTLNGEDLLGSRMKVEIADEDRRGKRPRTD